MQLVSPRVCGINLPSTLRPGDPHTPSPSVSLQVQVRLGPAAAAGWNVEATDIGNTLDCLGLNLPHKEFNDLFQLLWGPVTSAKQSETE